MSREAMQMALGMLNEIADDVYCDQKLEGVITTLRQALETEQEPFEYWTAVEGWVKIDEVHEHFDAVGCGTIYKSAGEGRTPLYTAQPKQWVGLTDEEVSEIIDREIGFNSCWGPEEAFARAVEQALKEKNHGH